LAHCVRKRFENDDLGLVHDITIQQPCDNVRVSMGCIFSGMRVSNFQLNTTRGELDLTRFLLFWYQLSQSDALTAWHMLKLNFIGRFFTAHVCINGHNKTCPQNLKTSFEKTLILIFIYEIGRNT
jgi:hypothetical protein